MTRNAISFITSPAHGAQQAAAARAPDPIAALAAELDAGAITPEQALDRLVDAALGDQLPSAMPADARAELRGMLDALLRDDPHLSSLAARIGVAIGDE